MTPDIETEGPGTDVTRRTLLRAGAGAAGALAVTGLPAWARPVTRAVTGLRHPDSRPFPHLPAGHVSMPEIRHVVVLMMENHSFDNLLGMVPYQVPGRAGVDGFSRHRGKLVNFNRDVHGKKVFAQHADTPCQLHAVPSQAWNASHTSYDGGRNDGFVRASGPMAMRFWDKRDLPFTYALAEHFPIGERYFASSLSQTYPNRRFLFTGTASGTIRTDGSTFTTTAANGTIFDRLDSHKIDFGIYYQQVASWLIVPGILTPSGRAARQHTFDQFLTDAASGHLPAFSFVDPNYDTTSEENPQDIQVGERFVGQVVNAVMKSPSWKHTPCSSPTTSTAVTTTMCHPRVRSSRTTPSRSCTRATCLAATTGTGSGSRCSWSRPGPRRATFRASPRTTRRSPRSSNESGTCPQ